MPRRRMVFMALIRRRRGYRRTSLPERFYPGHGLAAARSEAPEQAWSTLGLQFGDPGWHCTTSSIGPLPGTRLQPRRATSASRRGMVWGYPEVPGQRPVREHRDLSRVPSRERRLAIPEMVSRARAAVGGGEASTRPFRLRQPGRPGCRLTSGGRPDECVGGGLQKPPCAVSFLEPRLKAGADGPAHLRTTRRDRPPFGNADVPLMPTGRLKASRLGSRTNQGGMGMLKQKNWG